MSDKKQELIKFLSDLENHSCKEIHLIWTDETKAGIGNKRAIDIAINALKNELLKQLKEV